MENKGNVMIDILKNLDYSPLFISIKTGIIATIIAFFLGIYAAWIVLFQNGRRKLILDSILTLPIVLPPTASGFLLLLIFSTRRPFGGFLYATFEIKVIQSFAGCVIAAIVIAFPLMYRNIRAAFEQVDTNLIYAARTLGMKEHQILWKIIVPTAKPGVASGTVLCFARAMGEYGATSMLAGNIPQKTATISQQIALVIGDGDYATAGIWVAIVLLISLFMIIAMNMILQKREH